jgi:hypothetical protein
MPKSYKEHKKEKLQNISIQNPRYSVGHVKIVKCDHVDSIQGYKDGLTRAESMAQAVEHLHSKRQVLSSNSQYPAKRWFDYRNYVSQRV